jgi:hypothetical protein
MYVIGVLNSKFYLYSPNIQGAINFLVKKRTKKSKKNQQNQHQPLDFKHS